MHDGMTFEGCMKRYGNFVEAHSRWHIAGFDRDDVRQEIIEVMLRCLRNYDVSLNVPFYPYFKRAVINQLCKLGSRGRKRAHLFAEVSPLPDDPDKVPAASEPDLTDLAASSEFIARVKDLSLATRTVVTKVLTGKPVTAAERRGARVELFDALGDDVRDWRCAQRVPLDSRGQPARRITAAVNWRPAVALRGG
jgi:DNA-directed RNA polymerase specialized sigma24 family protein